MSKWDALTVHLQDHKTNTHINIKEVTLKFSTMEKEQDETNRKN